MEPAAAFRAVEVDAAVEAMTPFWLPPFLALILTAVYLFLEEGRWGRKGLIAGVVALSFLLTRQGGVTGALGLVLQVGICVFLLLWLRIRNQPR